jgi:integrase/recombinase XerD
LPALKLSSFSRAAERKAEEGELMKKEKYKNLKDYSFVGEPFRSAIREYIEDCKAANFSLWTVFAYVEALCAFFSWIKTAAPEVKHFADVTRQILSDYQMHLYSAETKKGGKYSAATQHGRLSSVLRFFSWLTQQEKILINPGSTIQLPKVPKRLPRNYLSQREINKLLKAPDITTHLGLRNRAILETLYSTGIRSMELRNLELADINQTDGYLTIRMGKGAKDRVVPLGKAALHFIQLYSEKTRPVFAAKSKIEILFLTQHGEKMHHDTINQILNHAAKKARIKRRISAHSIRHTCATLMLRGRADIRHIQELLGHKSLSSTQIYTKVEISDLKKVHERCHPREKDAIDKR